MKKSLIIFALTLALAACHSQQQKSADNGPAIENSFFGGVAFNQSPSSVLARLYAQGFCDDATGDQDTTFNVFPTDTGAPIRFKILAPPDTAGFAFKGMKWANLQIQCDDKGLFCLTMHSKEAPRAQVMEQYKTLLQTLLNTYPMQETIVGQSSIEGQTTSITGHRYRHAGEQIQLTQNPTGTLSSISLSFTLLAP